MGEATDALEQKEQEEKEQQEAGEKGEQGEKQEQGEQQESQPQDSQQKAKKKQKQAAQKMKEMSGQMAQMMQMGGGDQAQEDATMLRQILDNLVLFSFDQESLMDQFKSIEINHNEYGKFLRKQSNLREHFEHVDDSLFALSLRQPKISEQVNKQITEVFFNIDKSLGQLSENRIYQGVAAQQYTITATNELASFLSDILDNMNAQMNPSMGQGGGDMQLPDIIMSQEQLNEQMKDGMKKSQQGKPKEGEGEKDGEGEKEGESEKSKKGKEGKQGEEGEGGENGNSQGEGEGSNEDLNGELYRIYQQQQQLRQALENKWGGG